MTKITFISALILASTSVFAQINFKDSPANMAQAGTTKDTLNTGTIDATTYLHLYHNWHFNTDRTATGLENPSNPGFLVAPSKASTRKGWRSTGVQPSGAATGLAGGNLGKTQGYGGGGDPVYFANVASLRNYIGSTTLKYPDTSLPLNALDSAVTCLFGMPNGGAALAVYPGKYKKTDTRVYYNLGGSIPTSDLSFTVMTYDAGTSGNTVNVKLVVSIAPSTESNPAVNNTTGIGSGADKTDDTSLGNTGPIRFEKQIFTSSSNVVSDSVRIDICKEFNLSIDYLKFKKVIVALITESSNMTPTAGVYDPVIAFDNFHINFWLDTPSIPTNITSVKNPTDSRVIFGKKGTIDITGATSPIQIYSITGQKVADISVVKSTHSVSLAKGIYLVAEKNKPTIKVSVQ